MTFEEFYYDRMGYLVGAAVRFYYGDVRINGFKKEYLDRPVMMVSNHQNALMDPLFAPCFTEMRCSFMTRADVFVPPVISRILYSFRMLPIFRKRDGAYSTRKNKVIFKHCVKLLEKEQIIMIFPEGNHNIRRQLRPLKHGFLNICLQAQEKNNWDLDILILPMLLNYEDHQNFGKDVVVNIGEPIELKDWKNRFKSNKLHAKKEILAEVSLAMKKEMLHIEPDEHYEVLNRLHLNSEELVHGRVKNVNEKYQLDKSLLDGLGEILQDKSHASTDLVLDLREYFSLKDELGLSGKNLAIKSSLENNLLRGFLLVLALPFYALGLIANYLPYLGGKIAADRAKDPCFKSSSRFMAWLVGSGAYHLTLITLFMNLVSNKLVYVVLFWLGIAFTGRIAMWWWKYYNQFWDASTVQLKKSDTKFQILRELGERIKRKIAALEAH